jgi:hypothetical protein
MRQHFGLILITVWLLFALVHGFFTISWLYWYYDWLDIPMHITGAFLIISTWFYFSQKAWLSELFKKPIFNPIFILIMIMITWEIYQLLTGKPISGNYITDTRTDLVVGLIGGILGYLWFSSRTIEK